MDTMNSVVHFEMPAEDKARMRKFYEGVFGWKTKDMGDDMGGYVVVQTTDTDDKGMIQKPGAINGGFYQKSDDPLSHAPGIVIAVPDIEVAMQNVKDAGGKVIGGQKKDGTPDPIPGVGLYATIIDTEGNRVSLLQPEKRG